MTAIRACAAAPDRRAARASAIEMIARPAAGSPSVRPNCRTTAAWCPASAAVIDAPDAVSFGLGAATASPAIQDSV